MGVQCGFPQLIRVHFTQTFIALHGNAAPAIFHHRIDQIDRAVDFPDLVFGAKLRPFFEDLAQIANQTGQSTAFGRAQDIGINHIAFFNAPQHPPNHQLIERRFAFPAPIKIFGQGIKMGCQGLSRFKTFLVIVKQCRVQRTRKHCLFQNRNWQFQGQRFKQALCLTGQFDNTNKVRGSILRAIGKGQHCILGALCGQILFHLAVALKILNRIAPFGAIKRRLGDIKISAFDQFRHLTIEERQ